MIFMLSLYSPYIPAEKTVDFNVSIWAGLISGLISGLFTGLIVGAFLWWMQKNSQESQERKDVEKEFGVFIQKLHQSFLYSSQTVLSHNGHECLPQNLSRALSLIEEYPLLYWEVRLKKQEHQEIMSLINSLLEAQFKFKEAANALDVASEKLLIKDYGSNFIKPSMAAFYAIVNNHDKEYVYDWFGYTLGFNERPYEFENLQKLPYELSDLVNAYIISQGELVIASITLRGQIHRENIFT